MHDETVLQKPILYPEADESEILLILSPAHRPLLKLIKVHILHPNNTF